MVRPRRISDFKPTFTNLAQTSHYQVFFAGLPLMLRQHLRVRGLNSRFVSETAGLLCNSALLPGSRLATADIVGNRMGVSEKMAHSRIFTQIQLEFYVDNEYKTLKFLEHWMEFIANGSTSRLNSFDRAIQLDSDTPLVSSRSKNNSADCSAGPLVVPMSEYATDIPFLVEDSPEYSFIAMI